MQYSGKINLILGCMFSCKTSTLISRYKRYTLGGKKCIMIKNAMDTRYDENCITTHDLIKINAIKCFDLLELNDIIKEYDVILIDEIQFFKNADLICDKWANDGHIIEASGLNGTSDRTSFDVISKLIPLVDDITFLKAVCKQTGNDATFTKRLVDSPNVILIGGSDIYTAVDRMSYFKN